MGHRERTIRACEWFEVVKCSYYSLRTTLYARHRNARVRERVIIDYPQAIVLLIICSDSQTAILALIEKLAFPTAWYPRDVLIRLNLTRILTNNVIFTVSYMTRQHRWIVRNWPGEISAYLLIICGIHSGLNPKYSIYVIHPQQPHTSWYACP